MPVEVVVKVVFVYLVVEIVVVGVAELDFELVILRVVELVVEEVVELKVEIVVLRVVELELVVGKVDMLVRRLVLHRLVVEVVVEVELEELLLGLPHTPYACWQPKPLNSGLLCGPQTPNHEQEPPNLEPVQVLRTSSPQKPDCETEMEEDEVGMDREGAAARSRRTRKFGSCILDVEGCVLPSE